MKINELLESKIKKAESPKPRNFVAKNAIQSGAGAHKDKKKAAKQGDVKHKNKEMAEANSSAMAQAAKRLTDPKDGAVAKLRAAGDKRREEHLKGRDIAKRNESMAEGLKDPKDNPCWKGYKPVGTKKKGGRTVPNCVPKESVEKTRSFFTDPVTVKETATAGSTSAGNVAVGVVYKNKKPKMQKPGTNALDSDNLMTGGSIKR